MSVRHAGRHRAPGYNPLNEIADIASRSAQPAMKASAVAVASGGLIASFAIPAAASSSTEAAAASSSVGAAPAAAPALAVSAPTVAAAKTPAFGQVGFTATAAPAAAPATVKITRIKKAAPAPATTTTTTRASRSATRTAPAAAAAPAAQAAAPAAAPAPTGGIVGIAASLSGIPYVYGGTTTRGFDCSGFTGYVYRQAGISLPRTAAQQQSFATRVSNPAPGDLVFFGYPAYHVGIYAGPGQLYDAQHPGTTTGLHSIWTSTNVSYGRVG